jgi:hypothetical protein
MPTVLSVLGLPNLRLSAHPGEGLHEVVAVCDSRPGHCGCGPCGRGEEGGKLRQADTKPRAVTCVLCPQRGFGFRDCLGEKWCRTSRPASSSRSWACAA